MPEPKAQLVDPQGPIDVPGMQVTGVTTATGGFVGAVQGAATGFAATTYNLNVGIVTATKFQGNTTGNVSGLADDTNINVGIITSTSFTGDLVGNAAGFSTTTANINAGIMSATSFAGNFTGVASGITGTPNIVVGIMTGTLKGDGSSLTGIAATNWIANNVTANSSTTTVDLDLGNVVKFTQSADTTVSFANTGTTNIVTFIRQKDATATARALTWPSSIKWDSGSAPTLVTNQHTGDINVITLLTRDEGVTWYGWESVKVDPAVTKLFTCGRNNLGQLGQNNLTQYSSPMQIPGYVAWDPANTTSQASAFNYNSLVMRTDGTLWAWGANTYGALGQNQGQGQLAYSSSPVQIPGTTWALALSSNNTSAAVKTDGTLWMWGRGDRGVLGNNQPDNTHYSSPIQIPGTNWNKDRSKTDGSGGSVFGALKTNGELWMWGDNEYGALGQNEHDAHRSSPVQVPGTTWDQFYGADYTSAAIKTDGTLWVWGRNDYGVLGQNEREGAAGKYGYSSPVQIPGTTWKQASCGKDAIWAIKTNGTLWAWGYNSFGGLGQNQGAAPNSDKHKSSPVQIPGTTWDVVRCIGGTAATAIKTDGTAWTWGANWYGELGQNNGVHYSSPTQLPGTWDYLQSGASSTLRGYQIDQA